jgi:hypothetical protein
MNPAQITVALNGRPDTEVIPCGAPDTGNCLDDFLDEIEDKSSVSCTASVIKASRDTLLIQRSAL